MNEVSLAVRGAVESGAKEDLEALRGQIDWVDLVDGNERLGELLIGACYVRDNREDCRSTVLTLMRMANEDGCTQLFETWEVDQGGASFVAPILDFIEGDFPEALVMFMDHGFDPLKVFGLDGLSALSLAQEQCAAGIENTIFSYFTRAKAYALLDNMLQDESDKVTMVKP